MIRACLLYATELVAKNSFALDPTMEKKMWAVKRNLADDNEKVQKNRAHCRNGSRIAADLARP